MTTSLIIFPRFRAFDSDGAVLAGGQVFTYAAGTSTPLASYTDYTGDTANTNPVVLDASGQADIWLSAAFYKVVLEDANGVVLWTVDNVGPGPLSSSSSSGFGAATNIASAALTDVGTLPSHFANITGTSTITSFGSSASLDAPLYLVKFASTATLTQSANLLLPMNANMVTVAQDHAWAEYLGSGAWRLFGYVGADGSIYSSGTINCATLNVTTTANLP